jgi:phosphoribosylaminoimidazole-succinocarboxamide synthase
MSNQELVHRGSTKDVYRQGSDYVFHFSDRYSVFDWGEMPDKIPGKGAALARFNCLVFLFLEKNGIKTHLLGSDQSDTIRVKPFRVTKESSILTTAENVFVPLEIIFRWGVAQGSSLLSRSGEFRLFDRFTTPMIEFTTKLERLDRPLTYPAAYELSGASEAEWDELIARASQIARLLKQFFESHQITIWDGKIELALGERAHGTREIVLVDTIGPDELRLSFNGVPLSKEVIRNFYAKTPWFQELLKAKRTYGVDFKQNVSSPEPMPRDFLFEVQNLYRELPECIQGNSDHARLLELTEKLRRYVC